MLLYLMIPSATTSIMTSFLQDSINDKRMIPPITTSSRTSITLMYSKVHYSPQSFIPVGLSFSCSCFLTALQVRRWLGCFVSFPGNVRRSDSIWMLGMISPSFIGPSICTVCIVGIQTDVYTVSRKRDSFDVIWTIPVKHHFVEGNCYRKDRKQRLQCWMIGDGGALCKFAVESDSWARTVQSCVAWVVWLLIQTKIPMHHGPMGFSLRCVYQGFWL